LFRHFFALPAAADLSGQEVGAVRGVLNSVLSMIERGATHIGVATDHVVESFRNDLYTGYKTSEGVPRELLAQFPILEEALEAPWKCIYLQLSPPAGTHAEGRSHELEMPARRSQTRSGWRQHQSTEVHVRRTCESFAPQARS